MFFYEFSLIDFKTYLERLSVAFLYDDVSCVPLMLQHQGITCDKLNMMLHSDHQLMQHVVAILPNAIAIPNQRVII